MPRRTWFVAGLTAIAVLGAGCTGGDRPSPPPTAAGPSTSATSSLSSSASPDGSGSSSPTVEPAMVSTDGFERLNVLPAPVASQVVTDHLESELGTSRVEVVRATRVGSALRVVVAWQLPAGDRRRVGASAMRRRPPASDEPYQIGLKVYDPVAGTVAAPLRGADGGCVCSTNTGRIIDAGKQALYWADFPAPPSDRVTLLMGESVPPLEDVAVTADQPPLELAEDLVDWAGTPPPDQVGGGSGAATPVRRSMQSFGGAEDAQVGGNADVSLPADVLFAVDSSTLNGKAQAVLAAAAPKLVQAAKGKRVQVVGHTDDQGSTAYNDSLSLRRAKAVVVALAPRLRAGGITLTAVGKGESEHVTPNTDASGKPIEANRQRNRRVSFVFPRARGAAATTLDAPKPLPAMPIARKTSASPLVSGSLATVLSTAGDAKVHVTRLERSGSDLRARLEFTSAGPSPVRWGSTRDGLLGENPYGPNDTLANVRVVDAAAKTLAGPLSVGDRCLCSENQGYGLLYPDPMVLWATFPAPPAGVTKVTLRVPGAGQVVGVPVG